MYGEQEGFGTEARAVKKELKVLQRAKAPTSRTFDTLRDELESVRELFQATETFACTLLRSRPSYVQNISQFVRRRTVQALKSRHQEVGQRPNTFCPGNSVLQVLLTTKPTDCTLCVIRALVHEVHGMRRVHSEIDLCVYLAMNSLQEKYSRMSIIFDSYRDLCEALQIETLPRATLIQSNYVFRTRFKNKMC